MSDHAPLPLLELARRDPVGVHVLADWYDEAGQPGWARWLRLQPLRWRGLARALEPFGGRIQRLDAGFLWAPARQPAIGQEHLSWRVRDPEKADLLLGSPLGYRAHSVHLNAWRARTALPRTLALLARRRPGLTVLELTGAPVAADDLRSFTALERLTFRPAAGPPAFLSVRSLHLRVRSPADLEAFGNVRTPHLRELFVSATADGRFPPIAAELARVFDRPYETLKLDRELRNEWVDRIVRLRPDARLIRDSPRSWDQDWRRWVIDL